MYVKGFMAIPKGALYWDDRVMNPLFWKPFC